MSRHSDRHQMCRFQELMLPKSFRFRLLVNHRCRLLSPTFRRLSQTVRLRRSTDGVSGLPDSIINTRHGHLAFRPPRPDHSRIVQEVRLRTRRAGAARAVHRRPLLPGQLPNRMRLLYDPNQQDRPHRSRRWRILSSEVCGAVPPPARAHIHLYAPPHLALRASSRPRYACSACHPSPKPSTQAALAQPATDTMCIVGR